MPKTKIVCTIGPASGSLEILEQLIEKGMNIARLNFSHGSHDEHLKKIQIIREISSRVGKPIGILQDLGGPKIRVASIPEPGIQLRPGQKFILSSVPVESNDQQVSISYPALSMEVQSGDRILLADGMMELRVLESDQNRIFCEVITGGVLTSHKGINVPTNTLSMEALTEKDHEDLQFGIAHDVDYVGLSFVKNAEDITQVKEIIKKKKRNIPVIAKIERHEALDDIDNIVNTADGIMVARGDLGVEIPLEQVPRIQKSLIRKANTAGIPVIIATQMLRSMVDAPRPTRAEATDVANAVLDGADAVMLSEETASGNHPVESVQYLVRIAEDAEKTYPHGKYLNFLPKNNVSESVSYASCILADHLKAAAIIASTKSGSTARNISRFRPDAIIIALSPDPAVVRRLSLCWGCIPSLITEAKSTDELIEMSSMLALESGFVKKGEHVVITAGQPVWVSGTTNMLRVKQL